MKTTIHYFSKCCSFAIFFLMFSFIILASCKKEDGKGIHNPIPSENPISFTSAAQTKVITVKNLVSLYPEKETDKRQCDEESGVTIIESDWLTVTSAKIEGSYGRRLTIEVKENALNETRTYNLSMTGMPGEGKLTIIQAGKQ